MRIIIIGGVAAGTTAATNARRQDPEAEIVLYEKDSFISYSTCGMPYYIGGIVEDISVLAPRNITTFANHYHVDVEIQCEVKEIDAANKEITIERLTTNEIFMDHYDKLIIATGAQPFVPDVEGFCKKHVFTLRTLKDAKAIKDYMKENNPRHVCIIGSGAIAMELVENLLRKQMIITVIEKKNQIMPKIDADMASLLEEELADLDVVTIRKNVTVVKIEDDKVVLEDGSQIDVDFVIVCAGIRPNTYLAKNAGVLLGENEAIEVDEQMKTSVENIYACGDCIVVKSAITGKKIYHPLATTANKTGLIAGENAAGKETHYAGSLGTSIFRCLHLSIGMTGLTEEEAKKQGYDIKVVKHVKDDKSALFHGDKMVIKAIADKKENVLLGVQIIGGNGVDKRIDVFATLIMCKADLSIVNQLDLCYAPPYSTVRDPVHYTALLFD